MRTETVILTNMCMICDGDRILVQDKVDKEWGGVTFPGGHVEKGESFTDSIIREVFEETGLTVSSPRLCGIKDWTRDDNTRYMVLMYKTDKFSGELRSSEEGEVFWVNKSDFLGLKLAPTMEEYFKVFWDDDLSELYYYKENGKWVTVMK